MVNQVKIVKVVVNATAGILNSTHQVVLKNTPVLTTTTRLDRLTDVSANNEDDGSTLVYNAANDTYIVQKLDLSNVTGDLDGGTF